MCGIIGSWGPQCLDETARQWCERELAQLAHRGPEGRKVTQGPNYVLGHTLLSFHDFASASQPYHNLEHNVAVVFNGEIYNYRCLRNDLLAAGVTLSTSSECELIATLWRREGYQLFHRLRGMFALAIVDQRQESLVLARDYIGKKPLFFAIVGDDVHFASEAGPLQVMQRQRKLDLTVLKEYFSVNSIPADRALMRGLQKVAPGEVVTVSSVGTRRHRYWQTNTVSRVCFNGTIEASADHLEHLLRLAISRRLEFEGNKLGILLSGGLDSSLIASLAVEAAENGRETSCFTATFDGDQTGDLSHARRTAAALGLQHVTVHMSGSDLNGGIDKFLAPLDEPIADPSLLAVAAITEQAKGEFKAFLTGDGADDLFMGYQLYRALGLLHLIERVDPSGRISRHITRSDWLGGSGRDMGASQVLQMLARAIGAPDNVKFRAATSAFSASELATILLPEIDISGGDGHTQIGPEALRSGIISDLLQARILPKLDRGSMMNGVEFRSPFLDQDVAEYALSLPTTHLLSRGRGKKILRHIARTRLDPSILARGKRGFRLPMDHLMRTSLRERILDTLSPAAVTRGGIFKPRAVSALLSRHMNGQADLGKKLWSLFCMQLWQDTWDAYHV
ncbi:asparagine synthase (glutamine-hydrolyzing) [Shinella sumterensis]|uniref:asparagine synthase (glutamine-hydrolyzing) n=1 Tax=Shinella sumterensis TaxID=1967501 RepID=UPI003F877D40